MLSQIQSILIVIFVLITGILVITLNSKNTEITVLQTKINNLQLKQFEKSSELAIKVSSSYEESKKLNDDQYKKIQNTNISNTPCISNDSLQELNKYILTSPSPKP